MSGGSSVSVWQGPFLGVNEDVHLELTEQDKTVLSRLQRGERGKGLNLERINGARKHVLTIRSDKKRRLFLWMEHDKIIVIHIMKNHKHDRVPDNVMNFIFDGQPVVALNYEKVDEVKGFTPDPNFQLKEIKSAACYNQNLIVYDDHQESILEEKLPILLHGDFGCGKSALARSMLIKMIEALKDSCPDKDFVYYSHLPDLVRHMFDGFLLDNPNLANIIDLNRIKFLDTLGLVREYGPDELANKKPVGLNEFKQYLMRQYQNELSQMPFIDIHADIEVLYDEFQIIMSLNDNQAYLTLGSQASNYAQPDLRAWLVAVVKNYCERMCDNNEFDPCVTFWQPESPPLAFLVGDEIQGAPLSVIKMIPSLVYGKQNIMLCGDSNQSERRLSVLPRLKALFNKGGAALKVRVMPGSYRSPAHIMPLINAMIGLKQYINNGLNDNYQSPVVECKSPTVVEKGSIHWVDIATGLQALKAKLSENNTVYVVITHEAYVDEAKRVFGQEVPVYTTIQARGMEFLVVVEYRLLDKPMPVAKKGGKTRLLSELINPLIADMPITPMPSKHQPKSGRANPIYEPELNASVIALSRLVGDAHCFVVEVSRKRSKLQEVVKAAIMQGQALMKDSDQTLAAGTAAEWEALALQNIEAGRREQALVAYRRLGKTENDLDRDMAIHKKNKQDRIDRMKVAVARKQPSIGPKKPLLKPLPAEDQLLAPVETIVTQEPFLLGAESILKAIRESNNVADTLTRFIAECPVDVWCKMPSEKQEGLFLQVLAIESAAKAFLGMMLKPKPQTLDFIKTVFNQIDWVALHHSDDRWVTRLHWMMDHPIRALVFKNAWNITKCIRIPPGKLHEVFSQFAIGKYSVSLKTLLPLFALLAVKHFDFLKSVVLVFPGIGEHLADGLLEPFMLDGRVTNAIAWLSEPSNAKLTAAWADMMCFHDDELLSLIKKRKVKTMKSSELEARALNWCAGLSYCLDAGRIVKEKNTDLLIRLFRDPNLPDVLMYKFMDKKTLVSKIMEREILRECFFNQLFIMIINAKKGDQFSLMLDKLLNKVDFDFNALVCVGFSTLPLLASIYQNKYKETLLPYFRNPDPETFYRNKVEINSLITPYPIYLIDAELPVVYLMAKECSPDFKIIVDCQEVKNMSPSFWLKGWNNKLCGFESILMAWLNHVRLGAVFGDRTDMETIDTVLAVLLSHNSGALLAEYLDYYLGVNPLSDASRPGLQNPLHLIHVCLYLAAQPQAKMKKVFSDYASLITGVMELPDILAKITFAPESPRALYYLAQMPSCYQSLVELFCLVDVKEAAKYMNGLYRALTKKVVLAPSVDETQWSALACLANSNDGVALLSQMLDVMPGLAAHFKESDFIHPHPDSPLRDSVMQSIVRHCAATQESFIGHLERDNSNLHAYAAALPVIHGDDAEFHALSEVDAVASAFALQVHGLFSSGGSSMSPAFKCKGDIGRPQI